MVALSAITHRSGSPQAVCTLKKNLQIYSLLSNPLSKLKGSPSAMPRFLRGSSLSRFLSFLSLSHSLSFSLTLSLFFSISPGEAHIYYRLVTVTAFIMPWLWSSCQIHCGAFFFFYWCCVRGCPADRLTVVTRHPSFTPNRKEMLCSEVSMKCRLFIFLMHVCGLSVRAFEFVWVH